MTYRISRKLWIGEKKAPSPKYGIKGKVAHAGLLALETVSLPGSGRKMQETGRCQAIMIH
nr:unnamed protein product [Callosobruchus chinensis]